MPYPESHRSTPNVSRGTNERLGCVLHHTAGSYDGAVSWLCNPKSKASAHVVIGKDGRRCVLASDEAITWHAGDSIFNGRKFCNRFMLGVEFELTVDDVKRGAPLTHDQIESLLEWMAPRWNEYGWSLEWITDHRQVAVPAGRKQDLSPYNWMRCKTAIAAHFEHRDRAVDARRVPILPPVDLGGDSFHEPPDLRDP